MLGFCLTICDLCRSFVPLNHPIMTSRLLHVHMWLSRAAGERANGIGQATAAASRGNVRVLEVPRANFGANKEVHAVAD